jgi:lactococcin 972 family bacteriocin
MKKIRNLLLVSLLALSSAGGTIVYAHQQNVSGGTWKYGKTPTHIYSDYYHPRSNHGSKVVNIQTGATAVGNQVAGAWAKASLFSLFDGGSYYYKPNGFY